VRRLAETSEPAAHADLEYRIGEIRVRIGEYDQALVYLTAARRQAEDTRDLRRLAQIDLVMGAACNGKSELDRARAHLERAMNGAEESGDGDLYARSVGMLGETALAEDKLEEARHRLEGALAHYEKYWNGAELARTLLGLAAVGMRQKDLGAADTLTARALDEAKAAGDPLMLGRGLLARAEVDWLRHDPRAAKRCYRRALSVLQESGLRRDLAEAFFRYGIFTAEAQGEIPDAFTDPPAFWLAKAQALFQELGGLGDLERVREAFRRHGRRATDRVSEVEVRKLMQVMKGQRLDLARSVARVVDESADWLEKRRTRAGDAGERVAVDEAIGWLTQTEQTFGRQLADMAAAEENFLAALNTLILERENIRLLLDLTRQLSSLGDFEQLMAEIAKMAAQLVGADRALVILTEELAGSEARGASAQTTPPSYVMASLRFGDAGEQVEAAGGSWRGVAEQVLRRGAPVLVTREQAEGGAGGRLAAGPGLKLGVSLGTPLRKAQSIFGAVYVDKDLCGGVFTERDLDLLTIFSVQVATILENTRIAEELRLAARSRAATIEAIQDGVMSVDADEIITSLNPAAARALGAQVGDAGRIRLSSFPDLGFLRTALARGEEFDGRTAKLPSGDFLVNARVVRGDGGEVVSCVATFTEMKRAQNLAQKIVGSGARFSLGDIVGGSPQLRRRLQLAEAAARSDSSVLVTGESGTGKELFAQAIHNASARAVGPFVGINCSAIPRELLESELFGYEAGAFTGAKKGGHPGKFELAEGGTILLDEIGDMPLEMQVKLLRVLQEKRLTRVGGTREVKLDARLIATTNRDLGEDIERGRFRQDLYYRLKVISIELPPLRERAGDIPRLVDHFVSLFSARLGKRVRGVAPEVQTALEAYAWPGNIRELEHVLEGEVNLATTEQLELDEIPDSIRPRARRPPTLVLPVATLAAPEEEVAPSPVGGAMSFEDAERELLLQALTAHQGRVPDVARALGVSRGTVYNKLRKFQIDPTSYRGAAGGRS
jgi:transcriptional regulator with PAS, ATPase and Fis domain